eukprot:298379_1
MIMSQNSIFQDIEMIVSIDFGSDGFATAVCPPVTNTPGTYIGIRWVNRYPHDIELHKFGTALLIKKETKETIAMGNEALDQYVKYQEKKEDDQYMYFHRYKSYLYKNNHNISKNLLIKAVDGHSMLPLSELIIICLQNIVKEAIDWLTQLNKMHRTDPYEMKNLLWILTVPSGCDEMAKEFIKFCAQQTSIIHFELALDSIAAAFKVINCQTHDFRLTLNEKIMILDCGADKIDVSCFEIVSNSHDLSLCKHSELLDIGGLSMNDEFMPLFRDLLTPEIVDPVKEHQPPQWVLQQQEFVYSSWTVPLEMQENEAWNVPFCFGVNTLLSKKRKRKKKDPFYKKLKERIKQFTLSNILSYDSDEKDSVVQCFRLGRSNLKVYKNAWLWLHNKLTSKVAEFIRNHNVDYNRIILVGGLAHNKHFQKGLKDEFPNEKFYIPRLPHLCVVEGACYWMCQRQALRNSRPNYFYGIQKSWRYIFVHKDAEYVEGYRQEFSCFLPAGASYLKVTLYGSEYHFRDIDAIFVVKRFKLKLEEINEQARRVNITLEYRSSGINCFYIDDNGNILKMSIDFNKDNKKLYEYLIIGFIKENGFRYNNFILFPKELTELIASFL